MDKSTNKDTNKNAVDIPWQGRAIILLDLDAFFASVEQLDHPNWRGKPVIVGGSAKRRGVVSTCSYEARAFGVRSAMPASTAAKLCPDAIWTPGNFQRYQELSSHVMDIMRAYSPLLQQVSIDEAFLDISPTHYIKNDPVQIASAIQEKVAQLGITASLGLGTTKAIAKIASDMDKPQGLTIVYPGREQDFLAPLPIKVMSGIGPKAQVALKKLGVYTLGDVANATDEILNKVFGTTAPLMRARCSGADTEPVVIEDTIKSVSNEMSFAQDISCVEDLEAAIATVAAKVGRRLRMKGLYAKGVVLKVKYANLSGKSATATLSQPSNNEFDFIPLLRMLLDDVWMPGIAIRLIGAAAIHLSDKPDAQLSLFAQEDGLENTSATRSEKETLAAATDAIKNRFGEAALQYGSEMRTKENLTGSSSKNPADYK